MRILAIQNRMGIGDMIIFLPFIEEISKKFGVPISILVKESSKADQYLKNTEYIKDIILLKRNNQNNGEHDGIKGFLRLSRDIKKYQFDKVIIFNSSLRFNLICKLANIKNIYQYPLFEKNEQHLINAAGKLLKEKFKIYSVNNPRIQVNKKDVENAQKKFQLNKNKINIMLGIGGSGPTKRVPAYKFVELIKKVKQKYYPKFFLATGNKADEQEILNEILNNCGDDCVALNKLSISETLPIIKNCDISVCNDSSFSHISSALNIPTIVLMCDTPLMYGNYSTMMHPIQPDGIDNVRHGSLGKDKINSQKIFNKIVSIIN